ncbi:ras family small GTPase [Pelomyxa schiedti]|nr:ras family small GTPase [Pelomyxa schiedti]
MWCYTHEGGWKLIEPKSTVVPAPRWGHSAVLFKNTIFIFGGFVDTINGFSNELYCFNTKTLVWTLLDDVEGKPPSPRQLHTAVTVGNHMFVLGGFCSPNNLSDFHRFDFRTLGWEPLPQPPIPATRGASGARVYEQLLAVYGGRTKDGPQNDLWLFNTVNNSWEHQNLSVTNAEELQLSRYFHSACEREACIWVFGGLCKSGNVGNMLCVGFSGDLNPCGPFALLPLDLVLRIVSFLRIPDLGNMCLVCKKFDFIASHRTLWRQKLVDFGPAAARTLLLCDENAKSAPPEGVNKIWKFGFARLAEPLMFIPGLPQAAALLCGAVLKVGIFGAGGVGKSSLLLRFIRHEFVEEYDPSLEDSYPYSLKLGKRSLNLDIIDTTGSFYECRALVEMHIRLCDAFLICYSITDEYSFTSVSDHFQNIRCVKDVSDTYGPQWPGIVLVATKCDLESERRISYSQGEALAKSLGIPFLETSAKTPVNVDEVFYQLVRERANNEPLTRNAPSKPPPGKCNVS